MRNAQHDARAVGEPTFVFDELIARVHHTVKRSRELNEWSHRLAQVSKRLTRPRIRGGSDARPTRTERTVDKARRGGLPAPIPDKEVWIGPGASKECSGCGDFVDSLEREVEMEYSTR